VCPPPLTPSFPPLFLDAHRDALSRPILYRSPSSSTRMMPVSTLPLIIIHSLPSQPAMYYAEYATGFKPGSHNASAEFHVPRVQILLNFNTAGIVCHRLSATCNSYLSRAT
jgi:hypothetical protein